MAKLKDPSAAYMNGRTLTYPTPDNNTGINGNAFNGDTPTFNPNPPPAPHIDGPTSPAPPLPYGATAPPDPLLNSGPGHMMPGSASIMNYGNYTGAAGWDTTKLNDPNKHNTKYDFGRAQQDWASIHPGEGRSSTQSLLDFYNENYGGHAKLAGGDDMVDFGESYGPVDVWNGNGSAQWYVPSNATYPPPGGGGGAGGGGYTPPGPNNGPSSVTDKDLQDYLHRMLNGSDPATNMRLESAREGVDRARKSQTSNLQATLADRGLLGVNGIPQGTEQSSYSRLEDSLAGQYGTTLRDIYAHDSDNRLGAAGIASQHSANQNDAAIRTLSENRQWNQFITQFGLDKAKVMYDMQHGDTDQYLQLIKLWLDSQNQSGQGSH